MESLSDFGSEFQSKLIMSLFIDDQFARSIIDLMDTHSFDARIHKDLFDSIKVYHDKYGKIPNLNIVESLIDSDIKVQIFELLESFKTNVANGKFEDMEFVKDKSMDFFKKQNLKKVLLKASGMIAYAKYEEIIETIKNNITVVDHRDFGKDYIESFDERMAAKNVNVIPYPWPEINRISNNGRGMAAKEVHVFLACVGKGKSHCLIQCGAHAIMSGYNVLHYTFELSDEKTALRYDSYISQIPFDDLHKSKDRVWERINQHVKGKLIIKEYPTKTASCATIKNHISKLKVDGFIPDVIIVDYADLIKSVKTMDQKRFELESIYEDLRGIAGNMNVPVVTASQATKNAADQEVITMESIAEAYLKAATSDTIISLSRTIQDENFGTGRFFIAKNRSGISGNIFNLNVDTRTSSYKVISDYVMTTPDRKSKLYDLLKQVRKDNNER